MSKFFNVEVPEAILDWVGGWVGRCLYPKKPPYFRNSRQSVRPSVRPSVEEARVIAENREGYSTRTKQISSKYRAATNSKQRYRGARDKTQSQQENHQINRKSIQQQQERVSKYHNTKIPRQQTVTNSSSSNFFYQFPVKRQFQKKKLRGGGGF